MPFDCSISSTEIITWENFINAFSKTTEISPIDAKFSTPDNIRFHQLQELVYKYLFSISILNKEDRLLGLYILCGKKQGSDTQDVIHDIAQKIKRAVSPFAEILVMNGVNTDDYTMVAEIAKSITTN